MFLFKSGNIMDSECYALVNTLNTVGVMGKGIALQFKNEFPHNDELQIDYWTVLNSKC